jgi:hypothetical protein
MLKHARLLTLAWSTPDVGGPAIIRQSMEIGKGFLAVLGCPCSSPTTEITFRQALMGVSCPESWDLFSRPFISNSSALREASKTESHVVFAGSDGAVALPMQPASSYCL